MRKEYLFFWAIIALIYVMFGVFVHIFSTFTTNSGYWLFLGIFYTVSTVFIYCVTHKAL